ncbi:DNA-directed DNA polymerase, partial [Synchytrium microbalum]
MSEDSYPASKSPKPSVLEVLAADVMGPFREASRDGSIYYLAVLDIGSHYGWIIPLKKRADATRRIADLIRLLETQYSDRKIKGLQTDNAPEFTGKAMQEFLRSRGIIHRHTMAYSHAQNGAIERYNRTIQEHSKTMLDAANLDSRFWVDGMLTAVYLENRTTTSALKAHITPYEALNGKAPTYDNLRIFGCDAICHDPTQLDKQNPRAIDAVFIGYEPTPFESIRGWRFWDLDSQKVFYSRNVIFLEESNDTMPTPTLAIVAGMDESGKSSVSPASSPLAAKNTDNQLSTRSDFMEFLDESASDTDKIPLPYRAPSLQLVLRALARNPGQQRRVEVRTPSPEYEDVNSNHDGDRDDASPEPDPAPAPGFNEDEEENQPRRSRRENAGKIKPCCIVNAATLKDAPSNHTNSIIVPHSYKAAIKSDEATSWINAMSEEVSALVANDTWELVEAPRSARILPGKWVYTPKPDEYGIVTRYKARWVVQGNRQIDGVDFTETFAPTSHLPTLRILISLIAAHGWHSSTLDITTAFLNGEISEEVYVRQPTGFDDGTERVCRLHKSLYGLRQAPRVWFQLLSSWMLEHGLLPSNGDPCLYVGKSSHGQDIYVLVHVDDFLIASSSAEAIAELESSLESSFRLKKGGDLKNKIYMSQVKYVDDIIGAFGMTDCKAQPTPLAPGYDTPQPDSPPYLMTAVSILAKYSSNPTQYHWAGIIHVLSYVKGTREYRLSLGGADLLVYSDADWAKDVKDRISRSGVVTLIGTGA